MISRDLALLRGGSAALKRFPLSLAGRLAHRFGVAIAPHVEGTAALERNLRAAGIDDPALAARRGIGAYARYWVDILRLPGLSRTVIDRRFSYLGYHHILEVQRSGHTPIMVLPHLGSWEWAAAWLGRVDGQRVIAVVEELEPPDVFEWFRSVRQSMGVDVVPLGSRALKSLTAATAAGDGIICLVADRNLTGTGVEVSLFGSPAPLPGGPALLSLRTGNPLLPVAIYDRGSTRECRVCPPLWPERKGKLREDVLDLTQQVAHHFEDLINEAPDQWHVLSDIWSTEDPA